MPRNQNNKYEEDIPNFDPTAPLPPLPVNDEDDYPSQEPLVWSNEDIKKHWQGLQRTADSLVGGGAPVECGWNDHVFIICNWRLMADKISQQYKIHLPNPQEMEETLKSGHDPQQVEAEYLKAMERDFQTRAQGIINNQFLKKMNEALSAFFVEVAKQVCQLMDGKTIRTSMGLNLHYFHTQKEIRALQDTLKRIAQKEKLRMGAPGRGRKPKHKWTPHERTAFATHYESLRHEWSEAVKIFWELPQRRDNPKKRCSYVQDQFPRLPLDLIERIADGNEAHELALEHAARLCRIPVNLYTPRQLSKYLRSVATKSDLSRN